MIKNPKEQVHTVRLVAKDEEDIKSEESITIESNPSIKEFLKEESNGGALKENQTHPSSEEYESEEEGLTKDTSKTEESVNKNQTEPSKVDANKNQPTRVLV